MTGSHEIRIPWVQEAVGKKGITDVVGITDRSSRVGRFALAQKE